MSPETENRRGSSGANTDATSTSNKRRRTSDRFSLTVPDQPDADYVRSSSTPMALTRTSPHPGSSRDMTPPEGSGSLKYTRTGRVSKATKGQRVHHCEECGKTYTRAEHLRRHQQNHKPGAFPCDIPGCSRSFYREDLLTRHKARHDDPLNPPSRPQSRASHDSGASHERHSGELQRPAGQRLPGSETEFNIVVSGSADAVAGRGATQRHTKERIAGAQVQQHFAFGVPVAEDREQLGSAAVWNPSPPYSPRYNSPTNNDFRYTNPGLPYYHQPHPQAPRQTSHLSYVGYSSFQQPSDTPESAGSSTACFPNWSYNPQDFTGINHSSSDSETSCAAAADGFYNAPMVEPVILPGTYGSSRLISAVDRDLMEQDDLIVPFATRHDSLVDLSANELEYTNEDRYLGAYWLWVHPLFAIVHRPSFNLKHASPLLKAAMLALGAHALGDATDKTNARIVHERCIKVLKKRTANDWHSFRLCDMQAAVLVEVYALFKARRPPLQSSKTFEDVYKHLANDPEALNPLPPDEPVQNFSSGFSATTVQVVGMLCKQRLLAACYILDSQHATLFGRQRTTCYAGAGMDLPFPTSLASWDGQRRQPSHQAEPHDRVWQALDGGNMDESAMQRPHDVFQSMLMIACLSDSKEQGDDFYPSDPSKDLAPVIGAMQQSAQVKMAYNTFMLCKHTPVRDLLAVAGESWVMAEKLSSQAEYVASQVKARDWASAAAYITDFVGQDLGDEHQPAVQKAVRHALRIIDLHMDHPRTGLLFQEWSVYLAAVVVWAHSHATAKLHAVQRPRINVPNPAPPNLSSDEVEQTVADVVANAGRTVPDPEEARRVLLWAISAIDKVDLLHNCGLTNGALDVLGKLVARGTEDGWFGS